MGVFTKLILVVLLLLLFFVIGIGTLARVLFGFLSSLRPGSARRNRPFSHNGRFGDEKKAECMLACSVCGLHVPESEGIKVAGKFFCCEAHRK